MNKAPSSTPRLGSSVAPAPSSHFPRSIPSIASTPSSTGPARAPPSRIDVESSHGFESDDFSEVDYVPTHTGLTRFVISIDYGTTYTGIGWAAPETDVASIELVNVLQNWGERMGNSVKIPSVYSYTPCSDRNVEQFGFDLSHDAITMINTKLELDPQDTRTEELDLILQALDGMKDLRFDHIQESRGFPEFTWKGPEEIVKDYLAKVFQKFDQATRRYEGVKIAVPVDIIITVPVGWSYSAKNATFKAIVDAGFNNTNFPHLNSYQLVTEPEAAAIYTTQYLKQEEADTLRNGECFVVCDAGGGTVDVVGYKVKNINPTLELEAFTIPTSAKCGSSFINKKFKAWLRRILGDRNYNILDPRTDSQRVSGHTVEGERMRWLMSRFEEKKRGFNETSGEIRITLPNPLDNLTYGGKVELGELTITRNEMQSFFNDSIDKVIELVAGQVNQVENKRHRVKSVILIGGFSESEYLQKELQHSFGIRNIRLRRPEESWSAVIRGAVLYGIEHGARKNQMTVLASPKSYGTSCSRAFSKRLHNRKDYHVDPITGQVNARGQITWFVKKGDMLQTGEDRVFMQEELFWHFQENQQRIVKLPIYEYAEDDIPSRFEIAHAELNKVIELKADLSAYSLKSFESFHNPTTGKGFIQVCMICRVRIKGSTLKAELWWGKERMSSAEFPILGDVAVAEYYDESYGGLY